MKNPENPEIPAIIPVIFAKSPGFGIFSGFFTFGIRIFFVGWDIPTKSHLCGPNLSHVSFFLNSKSPLELMDLQTFLRQYEDHIEYQLQIITRESSVQLIFQFCLIIYQFINLPAIEVTYRNLAKASDYFEGVETVQWLSGLILRIVSIFLSAYSTLSWPLKVH